MPPPSRHIPVGASCFWDRSIYSSSGSKQREENANAIQWKHNAVECCNFNFHAEWLATIAWKLSPPVLDPRVFVYFFFFFVVRTAGGGEVSRQNRVCALCSSIILFFYLFFSKFSQEYRNAQRACMLRRKPNYSLEVTVVDLFIHRGTSTPSFLLWWKFSLPDAKCKVERYKSIT